ncbi:MAG: hypothetical protein ACTSWY_06555 [Promethearchaeota archaeon]
MIKTHAELIFHPTEIPDKLKTVLENLVGQGKEIKLVEKGDDQYYSVDVEGLGGVQNLYRGLREQLIVQSARKILTAKMDSDGVSFMLNKQALLMRKFHFCFKPDESPMGPVWVRIESDSIERLLDYLVPDTRDGTPLEVDYVPD